MDRVRAGGYRASRRAAAWFALLAAVLGAGGCATGPGGAAADACLAAGAPVRATVLQTLRGGPEQSDPFTRSGPPSAPRFIPLLQPTQVAVVGNDLFVADAGQSALLRVDRALQPYARFAPHHKDPRARKIRPPMIGRIWEVDHNGATEILFI